MDFLLKYTEECFEIGTVGPLGEHGAGKYGAVKLEKWLLNKLASSKGQVVMGLNWASALQRLSHLKSLST